MPNKATFAQNAHTAIPAQILEEIIGQFQITHSYFSSPITCHTNLKQFSSPHQRDQIFGSMGQAFDYKWQGSGYAHPPNHELTIQALHWARLAAQADPKNQTILILTNPDWHSGVVMLQLALEQGCHADVFGQTDGRSDDGRGGVRDLDAL
jgi:hypothetical protein